MDPAIEAVDVRFAYGDGAPAVDGVSLTVEPGTVAALLGPNGAGKTTFVRLATGILTPDRGSLSVLGTAPASLDRERIGVLPQAFVPSDRLTPRELVTYYAGLFEAARAPGALLEELGLVTVADRQYRRLSGGEQRRCCLAATLVNDPDLLVLDEPTAGIDPAGKRAIWAYLPALVEGGTTILLTSHDMLEVEHLAERVGFFHEGSLIAYDRTERLSATHLGQRNLDIGTDDPRQLREALSRGAVADGAVVVEDVDAKAVADIVAEAMAAGPEVTSIRWEHPPLEELFLALAEGRAEA